MANSSDPFDSGYLQVDDLHTVYYEQHGQPDGKPGTKPLQTMPSLSYKLIDLSNILARWAWRTNLQRKYDILRS